MSETKPSVGALRAAEKLEFNEPPNCVHANFETYCSLCFTQWEAEIIDREMATPQVEELLKSIRESDRIYDHVRAAAREVEAALKGEA